MMGRPREPVDLIIAKGKTPLTDEQIEERRSHEIDTSKLRNIKVPDYLSDKQKEEFRDLSDKLLKINIFSELDEDLLARYIISNDLYLSYTSTIADLIGKGDLTMLKEMQNLQTKAFNQCHACARELGLTISSRCRLNIPHVKDEDEEEEDYYS